ncbi:hypothetical protein [Microbacterium kyungheense]|uniref:Uncharacterized protein n=1 Tax=Microbacterium kyungheense TaxID=1263636 RepID=A0A543FJU0_9MICO|nr:hypothetical protein [Microbacterium kyungheense]TQM33966.1 hypothetical protein FB391_0253 [Microbacterium kyungheense]
MESTPSSGSEPLAPSTRRAAAVHTVRELSRSRRVQTFGLGALCGALALSLLVVVTTIFAMSQRPDVLADEPAPVSEQRLPTPVPTTSTPAPTPTPSPTIEPVEEADAPPEAEADPAPPVIDPPVPEPEPEVAPEPTAPGNSGNAPGHKKKP